MDVPNICPQLNSEINDHSAIDDSISQDGGLTILASGNATINSNSGNGRAANTGFGKWGMSVLFQIIAVSVICDILICGLIMLNNNTNNDQINQQMVEMKSEIGNISSTTKVAMADLKKTTENIVQESKKAAAESKEGTIWILRRDILNSIDLHTSERKITVKQLKRIRDQFDYYKSIGGNHDVECRMDDFNTKMFGTGEIKVLSD